MGKVKVKLGRPPVKERRVVLAVRVSPVVAERLREMATAAERDQSDYIRRVLTAHVGSEQ